MKRFSRSNLNGSTNVMPPRILRGRTTARSVYAAGMARSPYSRRPIRVDSRITLCPLPCRAQGPSVKSQLWFTQGAGSRNWRPDDRILVVIAHRETARVTDRSTGCRTQRVTLAPTRSLLRPRGIIHPGGVIGVPREHFVASPGRPMAGSPPGERCRPSRRAAGSAGSG